MSHRSTIIRPLTPLQRARQALQRAKARAAQNEVSFRELKQQYKQLLQHSETAEAELRQLSHHVLSVQEEERRQISRELHDEVGQTLAGINFHLTALRQSAVIGSAALKQRIDRTQKFVEHSLDQVHRFARELRPTVLDDLGLIPALRSYIKHFFLRTRLRVRFKAFAGVEQHLDGDQRTVLYRVAQEALTNVARHAHAKAVTLTISQSLTGVRMEVADNGRSFAMDRVLSGRGRLRLGLVGMRERVEMVGGHFSLQSIRGTGTTVGAEIPFASGRGGKRA